MSGKNQSLKFSCEFVKGELSEEEKSICRGRKFSLVDCVEFIENVIGDGYKVTISGDDDAECLMAIMMLRDQSAGKNKGLMLSSRAKDITGLMTVLAYKHDIKYKGEWPRAEKRSWQTDI